MSNIGHNSGFASDQLKSIIDRIERLEDEKSELSAQIKDIYTEAKGNGYDVTALRKIVRMRAEDQHKRQEREAIIETYMHALGMLQDLPLGRAAIDRASAM